MRRGFTLIELSIVLIIIGVISGGILIARSMILTAKIQRFERELGQYDIAINNFRLNYKYLPGDDPFFIPHGNGDGILFLGEGGSTCAAPNYYNAESYSLFAHLSQAGMISANYVPWSPPACGGTMDASPYNMGGIVMPYTELDSKAGKDIGVSKYAITPEFASGALNPDFYMQVNASYVIPLETKFGSTTSTVQAAGQLYNLFGKGLCAPAGGGAVVSCNADNATFARLFYYWNLQ